jgi:hypothetical protein
MNIRTESYLEQLKRWPVAGRHILAQFAINHPEIAQRIGVDS